MKGIASLTLLLLPFTGWATVINSLPYTITEPGVYTLERNLTGTAPVLVAIKSADVTLDLCGHTISGSASQEAIHVVGGPFQPTTNLPGFYGIIKILNGGIRNILAMGIVLDVGGVIMEDLTVQASSSAIFIKGPSASGDVRRCTLSNVGQPALYLLNTTGCMVEQNKVYSYGGAGIETSFERSPHDAPNVIINNFAIAPGLPLDIQEGDINRNNISIQGN
jgi:hypothetical protein